MVDLCISTLTMVIFMLLMIEVENHCDATYFEVFENENLMNACKIRNRFDGREGRNEWTKTIHDRMTTFFCTFSNLLRQNENDVGEVKKKRYFVVRFLVIFYGQSNIAKGTSKLSRKKHNFFFISPAPWFSAILRTNTWLACNWCNVPRDFSTDVYV